MNDSGEINRIAVVIGSTGLIGTALLQKLVETENYSKIHIIGRKKPELVNDKIIFHQADLLHLEAVESNFKESDVYCCLGTTMKKAGSKQKFREVDYEMILSAATMAEKKSNRFILVSSIGANPASGNFYLKTKGETEKAVLKLKIPSIIILRPSILFGPRKEIRFGEKIGIGFMKLLSPLLVGGFKKYRGNESIDVAKAMIKLALTSPPGKYLIESSDITNIAKGNSRQPKNLNPAI